MLIDSRKLTKEKGKDIKALHILFKSNGTFGLVYLR